MPVNLNALIRYKTINSCLFGGRIKWSMQELLEACSEALTESRGRRTSISERTVRDDLRVMKSDILGFNAPIEQEKGLYFYSDPKFSILSLRITDAGLAERIMIFLTGLRNEIQHPELEFILEQLSELTGKSHEKYVHMIDSDMQLNRGIMFSVPLKDVEHFELSIYKDKTPLSEKRELSWGSVFEMVLA
jgi:hypothetical protein